MKTVKIPKGRPGDPADREKAFRFLRGLYQESALAHDVLLVPPRIAEDLADAITVLERMCYSSLLTRKSRFGGSLRRIPSMSLDLAEATIIEAQTVFAGRFFDELRMSRETSYFFSDQERLTRILQEEDERLRRLLYALGCLQHLADLCASFRSAPEAVPCVA